MLTSVDLCPGAGGQALGLGRAGLPTKPWSRSTNIAATRCATTGLSGLCWNKMCAWSKKCRRLYRHGHAGRRVALPAIFGGRQTAWRKNDRNLFNDAIDIIDAARPRAVMIENVRGFLGAVFHDYRERLKSQLDLLGYKTDWRLLNASDYGVPQLRPRAAL